MASDYTQQRFITATGANNTSPSTIVIPEGCILLQFTSFDVFDNPDSLVTQDQERAFAAFITSVLLPVFFLIALPGNVITAVVLYRHGLRERINLCVFCQSLLNAGYLINVLLSTGDSVLQGFDSKGKANSMREWYTNNHLNGFYGLGVSSQVLTAVIACERCFCVARPLKAQGLMKTRTMAIIILLTTLVSTGGVFLINARWSEKCLYNPATNITSSAMLLSDFYLKNTLLVEFLDVVVYGIVIPGTTIGIVSATTAFTAFKLKEITAWRAKSTSAAVSLSKQDIALTRMLVGTSILFVACTMGYFISRVVLALCPDFNLNGRQANLFILISHLTLAQSFFNFSFNIFVYYSLASRFRNTVHELFCQCCLSNSKTSKHKLDTATSGRTACSTF